MYYLFKRLVRSWKLFLALLLGIVLASTFFGGINVGVDTVAKQLLDKQISQVREVLQVSPPTSLSLANITEILDEINKLNIKEITHIEVISRLRGSAQLSSNKTARFVVTGISEKSRIYDGLTVKNGSSSLGANETYVWAGLAGDLQLGTILQLNVTIGTQRMTLNLTIAGFVDIGEESLEIVITSEIEYIGKNILIVDWDKTFAKLIDIYPNVSSDTWFLVFLDIRSLVNPLDIVRSKERIEAIESQVVNIVLRFSPHSWVYVYGPDLQMPNTEDIRTQFILAAVPVFLISWYLGTTVSDVSYNLRRREIGLLLTKGFSRDQLRRMFLCEAILIGLVGGMIGIGFSFALTSFFIQGDRFLTGAPIIGLDTIIATLIFSTGLAFLSVFQPSKRASKLDVIEALQEYRYVEANPHRKRWPWIALTLGSYKIVIWFLGIGPSPWTSGIYLIFPRDNILVYILLTIWILFDRFVLNYVGPILFFWGFTKIFILGSLRFQELVAKLVRFAGDFGALSTKNVWRNPSRTVALAFLIAMTTGYSFQIIGSYASEQDYNIRRIKFSVGSDIGIQMSTLQNLSSTNDKIRNMSDVSSTTIEYKFWQSMEGREYDRAFIALDPGEWLNVAYYESSLFMGRDIASAFEEMKNDNNTVILERRLAERLKLGIGDFLAVTFGSKEKVYSLRVVGFFGWPLTPNRFGYPGPVDTDIYWSYVPEGFYHNIRNEVSATGKILVKLTSNANGSAVAEEVRNLRLSDVTAVDSVAEKLSNPFIVYHDLPISLGVIGSTGIIRLGVALAFLAASLGTALATIVSLRERKREVGIMSVRGLSFRQIVGVLLTESLAITGFAVSLGAVAGLLVIQGNISSLNFAASYTLSPEAMPGLRPVPRFMVFPLDAILALTACCGLIFASTIIPIFFMAKRYVSELEKIVRGA